MPKLYFEFAWSMACFVISRLKRVSNCWGINRSLKKSKFSFPLNFVHPILVLTCSMNLSLVYMLNLALVCTCSISHWYVYAQSLTYIHAQSHTCIHAQSRTRIHAQNFSFMHFQTFSFMHVQSHTRIHLNTRSISKLYPVRFVLNLVL